MTVLEQIRCLESLTGRALRELFCQVVGLETTSNNRLYLKRRIAHALQTAVAGPNVLPLLLPPVPPLPVPRSTKAPLRRPRSESAKPTIAQSPRERDPRLPPPGAFLEREFNGMPVRVQVLEKGVEFEGRTYRSLSAVAREVTGTRWNGLVFFHLVPARPKK